MLPPEYSPVHFYANTVAVASCWRGGDGNKNDAKIMAMHYNIDLPSTINLGGLELRERECG